MMQKTRKSISKRPINTRLLYVFALLRTLTFTRLWNYFYSQFRFISKLEAYRPLAFSVETSTACNLSCPECPSGLKQFNRKTGNAKLNTIEASISKLGRHAIWLNVYWQGEPLLHPQFCEFVQLAKFKRLFVQSSTNGNTITKELAEKIVQSKLDRLIIALDGFQQETYSTYRIGGQVSNVFQAIDYLVEAKKKFKTQYPILSIQTLLSPSVISEIPEIQEYFKGSGANELVFKSMQVLEVERIPEFGNNEARYSRYSKQKFESNIPKNAICKRAWSSCVVSWDGNISPCCFDKDSEHAFGNIVDESSVEIYWKQTKGSNFRIDFINNKRPEICSNCSEGRQVWY